MTAPDVLVKPESRSAAPRRRPVVIGALVVVLVLSAVIAFRLGSAGVDAGSGRVSPSVSPTASGPPSTADIYAALAPSIVIIEAVDPGTTTTTGTGVVANADGAILTAFHVVKGAGAIKVTFADGTPSAATVAQADPTRDIATLVPATLPDVLVPAVLGNSDRLAVGNTVLAIGNQLGLTSSATAGVVSGLNRVATNPDNTRLTGLIQFDAAVNPGSSGGPLVNAKGETIGIVVALANPTSAGTFVGVGFAVPIGAALAAGGGDRAPQQ